MTSSISTNKLLVCACLMLASLVLFWYTFSIPVDLPSLTSEPVKQQQFAQSKGKDWPTVQRRDIIDNSGAKQFLIQYETKFSQSAPAQVVADPNKPETITTWWQAAAVIDWYVDSCPRYKCTNHQMMGNWGICQDAPFTVKHPCLVYSFGINWDYSFDNAMAKLGCEVHSFDPSMGEQDHKRGNHSYFHNLGIGAYNTDGFNPRRDGYVRKGGQNVWKMRTLKHIIQMLGHQNRVIDVLKIDIEGYEWAVVDNMIESGVLQFVRQFMLEFHLFKDFPVRKEYVYVYKTYTQLREMGFQEHRCAYHPKIRRIELEKFNNQADVECVNVHFERKSGWR